jgi:3-hydroxyacyl-[acyl-carrier-protein] dehydratase
MTADADAASNLRPSEQVFETSDLFRLLPHRYPFLMVDRIIAVRNDESCIGLKHVSVNEPFFQGHFPGNPVLPGVLLLEGMAQTAGAICSAFYSKDGKTPAVLLMTIDKAKFRRPVMPGHLVEYHMQRLNRRRTMWWFRGEAKVDSQLVAEAEIGAMLMQG